MTAPDLDDLTDEERARLERAVRETNEAVDAALRDRAREEATR
ncbi:hypothetical protein GCM10009037_06930 [Halarchaeum grantii]|uniref:Uncharacterized protein n=1 Tax=Halarchaeum grantii TaxID=1193105 RepID=A0A830F6X5_9EURY|nr:hypothetical protein [Halarchaeum grantii]GGL25908.1 hypothetical protein GCM10009037_06930 [Halarchaeum grantii]